MTAWTDHIKKFAKEHNMTYGCALSDPACSASYTKEPKKKSAKKTAVLSKDTMDAFPDLEKEDSGTPATKKPTKKAAKKADKKEPTYKEAKEFVFNYTPKKMTPQYKKEFNKCADILKKPFKKEQDNIFEELQKEILGEGRYNKDARRNFDDIVSKATPYNEAETIWNINRERVKMPPSFKRYKELEEEILKIPNYNIKGEGTCSSAEAAPPPPEPTPTLSRVYRNDRSGHFREENPMPPPPPKELTPINKAKAVIVQSGKPIGAAKPKGKNLPTALLPKAKPVVKPKKGTGNFLPRSRVAPDPEPVPAEAVLAPDPRPIVPAVPLVPAVRIGRVNKKKVRPSSPPPAPEENVSQNIRDILNAVKVKGRPIGSNRNRAELIEDTEGGGIKEFVNRVVYGKKDYSASIKKIIDKYGNEEVKEVELHRFVLPTIYTKILSVWTKGETDRRLQEEPKDKLFHISMWVKLGSGTTILVEKNTTINMKVNPTKKDKEEVQSVPMPPNGLTFRSMLEKTQKEMGDDKYFSYSAKDNNCGNYIEAVLKTNGMSSKATYDFINQDTKKILEGYPTLRKITNTLTDIGGAAETLLQGGAVQRFSATGYHYPITPELAKKMVLAHKADQSTKKKPRKISAKKQALANRAEVLANLAVEAANNKANLVANKQLAKKTKKDTELGEFLKKWTSA
jgi:hypothetical protein